MNYEQGRLSTFCNWPSTAEVDPVRIAKAGFYYTGQGLEVQCFRCGGKISEWNYGDQVMARHRRLDPLCPFVVDPASSGNVPLLGAEQSHSLHSPAQGSSQTAVSDPALIVTSSLTLEDEIYQNHALRLLSFINWPIAFISRESLVLAGFYHSGGGIVRCAYCGGELRGGWRAGDVPLAEHRRHFPECLFARSAGGGILTPGGGVHTSEREESQPSHTLAGTTSETNDKKSHIDAITHNEAILLAGGSELRSLGVLTHGTSINSGARHRRYAALDTRLSTYRNWPPTLKQTPQSLAEAGFYYTDVDDQVRCFYCDGGLGRWEPEDDPWTEHAQWFPGCGYVLLLKGKDFVDRCRLRCGQENATQGNVTFKPMPGVVMSSNASGVHPLRTHYQVTADTLERAMDDACARAALATGLQPERVRQAIRRKIQLTGLSFGSADALIDATLHEQLNESWSSPPAPTQCPEYRSRDMTSPTDTTEYYEIDDEEFNATPTQRNPPTNQISVTEDPPNIIDSDLTLAAARQHVSTDTMPISSTTAIAMAYSPIAIQAPSNLMAVDSIHENSNISSNGTSSNVVPNNNNIPGSSNGIPTRKNGIPDSSNRISNNANEVSQEMKDRSKEEICGEGSDLPLAVQSVNLEEENRQLKEARLCKVCMDNEVCVVFLPCGHLVSCASCSAGLPHCPLCRGAVRALVRAYLS